MQVPHRQPLFSTTTTVHDTCPHHHVAVAPTPTAMRAHHHPTPTARWPLSIAATTHNLHNTPSLGHVTSPSRSMSMRRCGEDPPPPNTNGNEAHHHPTPTAMMAHVNSRHCPRPPQYIVAGPCHQPQQIDEHVQVW